MSYGFELSGKRRRNSANQKPAGAGAGAGRILTKAAIANFGKQADSRARMQAFLHIPGQVPEEIVKGIEHGKLRLVDMVLFSTQPLSDTTKFFNSGDDKKPGWSNNKGNTLQKGYGFLVSKVGFRTGVAPGTSEADIVKTDYKSLLDSVSGGGTGLIKMTAGNRSIIQDYGTIGFIQNSTGTPTHSEDAGVVTLDNPRFITDNGEFSVEVQFPSGATTATTANTRIICMMYGTMVVPM